MSWAFKIILVLFATANIAVQEPPEFDRLKAQFENNKVFIAEFSHFYEDSFTGEQQTASGMIWIGKDYYKIEGGTQVMVVDGEISRVFDAEKNRVIISDYIEEEDDFAPSRMLQGVDDTYNVTESEGENGDTIIELNSDDPFSIFLSVTITLSEDGLPVEIEAIDQAENLLVTSFTDGYFTESDPSLFELDIPESAETVDLRHNTR